MKATLFCVLAISLLAYGMAGTTTFVRDGITYTLATDVGAATTSTLEDHMNTKGVTVTITATATATAYATATATATTTTTITATATTTVIITAQPTANNTAAPKLNATFAANTTNATTTAIAPKPTTNNTVAPSTTAAPKPTTTTTVAPPTTVAPKPTTTTTVAPPAPAKPKFVPAPGKFYMIKSKYGKYLDMRQEPKGDSFPVLALSEPYMNKNLWAKDSFLVQFVDQGNGYYMIKSKYGRYLDMRQDNSNAIEALALTEAYMNKNLWAKDSFLVQLIDNGDGYSMIKSKYGRYLDMRQGPGDSAPALSLRQDYMNANLWAKDSFIFQFIAA